MSDQPEIDFPQGPPPSELEVTEGDHGAGAAIAPGETLIFVVDLIEVR